MKLSHFLSFDQVALLLGVERANELKDHDTKDTPSFLTPRGNRVFRLACRGKRRSAPCFSYTLVKQGTGKTSEESWKTDLLCAKIDS